MCRDGRRAVTSLVSSWLCRDGRRAVTSLVSSWLGWRGEVEE
eukprot:COSAG06_NODE_9365_length_1920_cov_1.523339_1_plen_41_part_10